VLHVLEATLGGTLRFIEDILECSAGMPFSMGWVYATHRANSGFPHALKKALSIGWDTFRLEMTRAVNPISDTRSILALRRVLDEYRPDILHCHSSKAGAIGRIATIGLRRRPKLVYTPNALAVHLGPQYILAERALSPRTDCFAAVSQGECEEIVSYKLGTRDNINVISPGIDTQFFSPRDMNEMRRLLGIPEGVPVMLAVGRLSDQKDPLGFVEVARQLLKSYPTLRAIWVGDGERRPEMEHLIAASGLTQSVSIAGWQTDVRPYLGACNFLLSTSRYESFGYMVAEALAMQRPAVATRVNGTTDIMKDDLSSFLYTPGSYGDAVALARLILASPHLEHRMGVVGRETIKNRFSHAQMRQSLQNCYQQVLSQ